MKNIFNPKDVEEIINRINQLTPEAKPQWGKMSVEQMLAHCNVAYDMAYTDKYPRPNAFYRFMAKLFAKSMVVGPKPYPKNGRTAPEFIISDARNFDAEKEKIVGYLRKALEDGEAHFEGKPSLSFGNLKASEWNVLFYKHLDHHLTQFGV